MLAGRAEIELEASGRVDDAPDLRDLGTLDLTLRVPAADLTLTAAPDGDVIAGDQHPPIRLV